MGLAADAVGIADDLNLLRELLLNVTTVIEHNQKEP